jgi:GIY-YIG catalytic domain-containing protein
MMIPEAIRREVETYHNEWRHPRLAPLVCSELYALFPEETGTEMPSTMNWPEAWPNNMHAGVYFVFDRALRVMYVGMTTFFGARLSAHFPTRSERIRENYWKTGRPMFVATVAVTEVFEALALEGYLIDKFQPPENSKGKLTNQMQMEPPSPQHPEGIE